jgi:hypothetical protein
VVVVARNEDDLGVGQAGPYGPQHGLGDRERLVERAVAQLERVAQQHELLDAVEALQQRIERGRVAQDIGLRAGAQVQVGDDEGPHGGTDGSLPSCPPALWTACSSPTSRACSPARCAR